MGSGFMQRLPYFLVALGFLALMGEFYPMALSCFIVAYATSENQA